MQLGRGGEGGEAEARFGGVLQVRAGVGEEDEGHAGFWGERRGVREGKGCKLAREVVGVGWRTGFWIVFLSAGEGGDEGIAGFVWGRNSSVELECDCSSTILEDWRY